MKKYYKVKLTILFESIENCDMLDRIDENIIVEKHHGSFQEITSNRIFDIIWLEKNNQIINYTDMNCEGREFIPLTSRDLINYYNSTDKSIDDDYHYLYHNYYTIEDIFNDIDEKGYYLMIEPIFFNKRNDRATKNEVKEYLGQNNKKLLDYLVPAEKNKQKIKK